MTHLKLAKKNREIDPASWDKFYNNLVVKKIRAKYTVNDELAILRQRDTKPEEFTEYNAYVETCKAEVKAEMEG
jgi:hypothetical protein